MLKQAIQTQQNEYKGFLPYESKSLNWIIAYNNPIVLRDLQGNCPVSTTGGGGFWSTVGSVVNTVVTVVANFVAGPIAVATGFAVGIATGFNGAAMNSAAGAVMNRANSIATAIGGAVTGFFGGGGSGGGGGGSGASWQAPEGFGLDGLKEPGDIDIYDIDNLVAGKGTPDFEKNKFKALKGKGVVGTFGDILADEATKLQWLMALGERSKAKRALDKAALNTKYGTSKEFSVITTKGTWVTPPKFLGLIEGRNWVNFIINTTDKRIMGVETIEGARGMPPAFPGRPLW